MDQAELKKILELHRKWQLNEKDGVMADLSGANLRGANLREADLSWANLRGANNIPSIVNAVTSICPEGILIVYKKTRNGIVKLKIPTKAKRSNATGRKCRASYAVVLETPNHEPAVSVYCSTFHYEEGKEVRPNEPFCEDRWQECASGIHFYLTREEAEAN